MAVGGTAHVIAPLHWGSNMYSVAPSISGLDISKLVSFGLPKGQCVQEQTSHHTRLGRQHPTADQHRGWCSEANGGRYATSFSGVSSGRWRPFSTLAVKPSSSLWILICVTLVSYHSLQALRNYRPQRPHIPYESPCRIDRRRMNTNMVKWWNENWQGEIEELRKKPVPLLLYSPQIPHWLPSYLISITATVRHYWNHL
jgi:hypothetical protein